MSTPSKAGDYYIKIRYYYSKATSTFAEYGFFLIRVVDPCDPYIGYAPTPVITVPSLDNQVYTITDFKQYTVPAFTVTPAQCSSRLVYSFDPVTDSYP